MLSNPLNTAGKQTLLRACMPAALCAEKVRRSSGGNPAKALRIRHQKPYMQGLCVLHTWDSTRDWHSHVRWEIWTRSEVNFHKGIYLELQNFSNESLNRFSLYKSLYKKHWEKASVLLAYYYVNMELLCDCPEILSTQWRRSVDRGVNLSFYGWLSPMAFHYMQVFLQSR